MHPLVRLCLRHPNERSLHLLTRMLLHVSQDEEPFVGRRWERTGFIRRVAAARMGRPIHGAVRPRDHQRGLEMWQQGHQCRFRHRPERRLPARWVPSSSLGRGTSPSRVRTLFTLVRS